VASFGVPLHLAGETCQRGWGSAQAGRICFTTWYANTLRPTCSLDWSRLQSGEELPEAERPSFEDIVQNGTLAIVAGSDTTSSVLTAIIYYLLLNPAAYERLQEEVDSAFPSGEEPLDTVKLSHLEWLNGCM
jgi:hypothetical protein